MATRDETENFLARLKQELGEQEFDFSFHIPGWTPVDAAMGMQWVKSQLWEGFFVAYHVDASKQLVVLKTWELGEIEPPFQEF